MKDFLKFFSSVVIIAYFIISIVCFPFGLFEADGMHMFGCQQDMRRIEYVFPAYRLGCYLGKRVK